MPSHVRLPKGAAAFMALLAVLTALTVLFYRTVYVEQQAVLAEQQRVLLQRREELARWEAFSKRHRDASAEEEALKQHTDWSRHLLPDILGTGDFLSELQSCMLRSQVNVIGLAPGAEEQQEGFCRQRIELTVEGGYFEWLNFLRLLEQQTRFVAIETLSGQVKAPGILRGHVALYIFARRIGEEGAGK